MYCIKLCTLHVYNSYTNMLHIYKTVIKILFIYIEPNPIIILLIPNCFPKKENRVIMSTLFYLTYIRRILVK